MRVFLRHERCYGGALCSSARLSRSSFCLLLPDCQTPKIKIAPPDFYHQEVLYVVLFTSPVSCETARQKILFSSILGHVRSVHVALVFACVYARRQRVPRLVRGECQRISLVLPTQRWTGSLSPCKGGVRQRPSTGTSCCHRRSAGMGGGAVLLRVLQGSKLTACSGEGAAKPAAVPGRPLLDARAAPQPLAEAGP